MGKLKVWAKQLNDRIEIQKEEIYKRDYKFFKIDRLERINERIDEFSDDCEECEKLKSELEDIVDKLPEYINGSPRERAEYEKRNDKIVKHLKQKHGLVPKQYFSSFYSFVGFLSGALIFAGIAYVIHPGYVKWGVLVGFTLGIIIGKIIGNSKDNTKEKQKLIL